jgi:hypothetical protein
VTGAVEPASGLGTHDEPVHPAAVDVEDRVAVVVRAAGVAIGAVVVGPLAQATLRIGNAHALRNPVCTGIRAEVGVERAVLLHDHDHVPDLVDADEPCSTGGPGKEHRDDHRSDHDPDHGRKR